MKATRDLYNLNLLPKLLLLLRQILFSLAVAAIAEAIVMQVSAEQVPFLHTVALSYLKLITSSNFWPFLLISPLISFELLVLFLFLSVLSSIPYALALIHESVGKA